MYKFPLGARLGVFAVALFSVVLTEEALAADSATYTYDSLGRLVTTAYANGTTITYTYDAGDNRANVTVTCGSSGC
jgi:YD repeat-containing protein